MAFGKKQIYPNDLRPRVAIGFDLPINGNAVFTPNYETKEAIKNNLINFLLTNPGERVRNPEFGAGLREFIFEQITEDNLDFLKDDLDSKIKTQFPNIFLEDIVINALYDQNTIEVKIDYNIPNTNINDTLTLNFG